MSHKTGLTVAVSQTLDSMKPIEIIDELGGLQAAILPRHARKALPIEWNKVEGFYVLLSHVNFDNTFTVYVGQTDYDFGLRLQKHDEEKDYWHVAILFKNYSLIPFDRMQTRYMEGLLVEAMQGFENAVVMNIKPTGEKNLSDISKPRMEAVLSSALRIMFLRGYYNSSVSSVRKNVAPFSTTSDDTDKELFARIRMIAEEIKGTEKGASGYNKWAKPKNIEAIVLARPQNIAELDAVSGVGANFLSRGEDIVRLFTEQ